VPGGSGKAWLREFGLALVAAGFVVLLFVAYELVGTNLSEEHSQSVLAREFSTALAHASAGTGAGTKSTSAAAPTTNVARGLKSVALAATRGAERDREARQSQRSSGTPASFAGALIRTNLPLPPPGGALDHLVIPAIGLSRYVVQGVDESDLQMGPGHYPGTPLPGQLGNVGIAGHRTTFGAPFFRLNEVSRGDLVLLTDTSGTTSVYSVVRQWVVSPSDTAVLDPSRTAILTLTTCNPRFEATSRLVVRAVLVERVPRGSTVPSRPAQVVTSPSQPTASGAGPLAAAPRATSSTFPDGPGGSVAANPVQPTTTRVATGAATGEGSPTVGSAPSSASGSGAWLATVGFGLLALLGWIATRVFAGHLRRYSKALVLVAGVLVCLVPLWFAFEHLVDLLPANI
jgi:LPXTG-site transpeptidase (sortase) family protein